MQASHSPPITEVVGTVSVYSHTAPLPLAQQRGPATGGLERGHPLCQAERAASTDDREGHRQSMQVSHSPPITEVVGTASVLTHTAPLPLARQWGPASEGPERRYPPCQAE